MNSKYPTIVIVNGANWVGSKLTEVLIEQKGNVIVIDDFTVSNMPFIKRFASNKHFIFIEKDKIDSLKNNFTQIKYFIHLRHNFDTTDNSISSKNFINETRFVDEVLTIALEKESVYILTASIHLHKDFLLKKSYSREKDKNAYNESDLQDYIEKTVIEYVNKAGLNGRIVRLGNLYGPEMDLEKDPLLKQILYDAFNRNEIRIYNDGLEYMYYVYISDAIQGILKALFYPKTEGKIYAITNSEEISVLSIVNKILALQPVAKRIKFVKGKGFVDPLYEKAYIPDENLSEIGWKANVSFDRGIAQLFDYFKNDPLNSLHTDSPTISHQGSIAGEEDSGRIEVGFDDTINLADSFFGSQQKNNEGQQFLDFHQKLNNPDSPLFNSSHRKVDSKYTTQKERKFKKKYFLYMLLVSLCIFSYIFLFIPLFRMLSLFWEIKEASDNIVLQLSTNQQVESKNLNDKAIKAFNSSKWAVDLFGQNKLKDSIISTAKGLDDAANAKNTIEKNNLSAYINTNQKIPESSYSQVQELIIQLNTTKQELESSNTLSLPFGSSNKIAQIRSWAYDTQNRLSESQAQ